MTSLKYVRTWTLLLSCILFAGSCSAGSPASEIVFVGSTPGDDLIKSILTIPDQTKVDFIRWNLTLNKAKAGHQNTFVLNIAFAEAAPNTLSFIGGGEKLSFTGEYTISENKNINGEIYHLKSSQLRTEILLVRLNDNLFHLLTPQYQLMIGNGGWSYTLNRKEPLKKPAVLPVVTTSSKLTNDTLLKVVFEGRTPCQGFARDNNLTVTADCFKLKWKLTLNRDAKTLLPTTYKLQTTFNRADDIDGEWAVIKGTPSNPNAIIYQFYPDKQQKSFSLLAGDENVLFFLDKKNDLYVGNSDFSFTLNKRKAAIIDRNGITIGEAEQILGEPATLAEQTNGTKEAITFSKSTFTAKEIEAETNRHGNLYFTCEEYKSEDEARKLIQGFIQSNQNHQGFELLKDYGDAAFLHTDDTNFITLIAVKANKLIRLKVNKVTSKTSIIEFRKIAKNLVLRA